MKEKTPRPLLTSVKQEDFSTTLGGDTGSLTSTPQQVFSPITSMISKLAVGPYFWFIANLVNGNIEASGGMVEKVIPIECTMANQPPDILFRNTIQEDLEKMFAFTNHWITYFSSLSAERKKQVRPTLYIRMLSPEMIYRWVMVQYIDHIVDEEGRITFALTLVTDISHIKKNGVAMMSILDTANETCQLFFCSDGKALPDSNSSLPKISPRELEVVRLMAAGNSSKQIAAALDIAIKTIDNHRQNLLRKTGCKTSGELVAFAINMGYI